MAEDRIQRQRRELDEAIARQSKGETTDSVLNQSRGTLRNLGMDSEGAAGRENARIPQSGEAEEMARLSQESRVAPILGRAALTGASFVPGPVGLAAGGASAIDGLMNAEDNTSRALAMVGLIPGLNRLRGVKNIPPPLREAVHGPTRRGFEKAMSVGKSEYKLPAAETSFRPSMKLADIEAEEAAAIGAADELPMAPAMSRFGSGAMEGLESAGRGIKSTAKWPRQLTEAYRQMRESDPEMLLKQAVSAAGGR